MSPSKTHGAELGFDRALKAQATASAQDRPSRKTIGVRVGRCFRHRRQGQFVQGLLRSVIHNGKSTGASICRSSFRCKSASMVEGDSHVAAGCMQPAIWLGRLATGRRQCRGSFSPCWRSPVLTASSLAWNEWVNRYCKARTLFPPVFPEQPLRYAPAAF